MTTLKQELWGDIQKQYDSMIHSLTVTNGGSSYTSTPITSITSSSPTWTVSPGGYGGGGLHYVGTPTNPNTHSYTIPNYTYTTGYADYFEKQVKLEIDGEDRHIDRKELAALYKEQKELEALAEEVPAVKELMDKIKILVKLYRE